MLIGSAAVSSTAFEVADRAAIPATTVLMTLMGAFVILFLITIWTLMLLL